MIVAVLLVTSGTEHTLISEDRQCRSRSQSLPVGTPLIPSLE